MNWNQGFSSQFYATFVDPQSWRDTDRFDITGGTINRSDSGLRHSADLDCINYREDSERWVRIWMNVQQSGSSEHIPLFTGLATAPEQEINGTLVSNQLVCYSVLKPSQDILLPLGYYAASGARGADIVYELLSSSTPAPIVVSPDSPRLSQYIVAENNESKLSMVEKILSAINWRLRLDGNGGIEICSKPSEPVTLFDALNNDSIEPQLKLTNDWYSCPNVFRAVMGEDSVVYKDRDLNNPLSILNRGREIWIEEQDCKLGDHEGLEEYARRRLQEEQQRYVFIQYNRRFHPDVLASDLLQLHYPAQSIDGTFYVSSQSITLGYEAKTEEEVIQL